jgi:acetyl esterase/lipase
MLKNTFIFIALFCIAVAVPAQTPHRYKDMIFREVNVDTDLSYHPIATKGEKKTWLFDLYQPKGDDALHRPLIIWMHGGGFKFGSKTARGIVLWSKTFARRGYVCATINYHLSNKNPLSRFDELEKSSYYAVQDVKLAVEYFKTNAARYHIDPDKIILAGNSAGGIIALQAAYGSNSELADLAGIPKDSAAVNNPSGRIKAAAIINFWGGIFDLNWLKNARVPIVSVLGGKDKIVSPTHESTPLYGGVDVHNKATALGIPNELKVFDGYSHELQKHFNPFFPGGKDTQKRWLEAGQFAADFLYNSLF